MFVHRGQTRKIGNRPYAIHLAYAVNHLLEDLKNKEPLTQQELIRAIAATWLHDTVEDVLEGSWGAQNKLEAPSAEPSETVLLWIEDLLGNTIYGNVHALTELVTESRRAYFNNLGSRSRISQLVKFADVAANRDELIDPNDPGRAYFLFRGSLDYIIQFICVSECSAASKLWLLNYLLFKGQEANQILSKIAKDRGVDPGRYLAMKESDQQALASAIYKIRAQDEFNQRKARRDIDLLAQLKRTLEARYGERLWTGDTVHRLRIDNIQHPLTDFDEHDHWDEPGDARPFICICPHRQERLDYSRYFSRLV